MDKNARITFYQNTVNQMLFERISIKANKMFMYDKECTIAQKQKKKPTTTSLIAPEMLKV